MAFSHELVPVNILKTDTLDRVMTTTREISMGGTDCALPMRYALEHKGIFYF